MVPSRIKHENSGAIPQHLFCRKENMLLRIESDVSVGDVEAWPLDWWTFQYFRKLMRSSTSGRKWLNDIHSLFCILLMPFRKINVKVRGNNKCCMQRPSFLRIVLCKIGRTLKFLCRTFLKRKDFFSASLSKNRVVGGLCAGFYFPFMGQEDFVTCLGLWAKLIFRLVPLWTYFPTSSLMSLLGTWLVAATG